ncbi:hypothetical protein [Streptomyces prunicolor]|uniref:hypothetical protein n=1 Tax=Streptomyces prunicolor TaxID=67348 RepID=UPI00037E25CB|nr:hypothetical protein [Streptomyces prunicolor]
MSEVEEARQVGRVFEASWDDHPTWRGGRPFADLATAQKITEGTYTEDLDSVGVLTWRQRSEELWELTDNGNPTPVAIEARALYGCAEHPGALSDEELLALATEFRVPIPNRAVGVYGEVVVRPDRHGDRWAITYGAATGLQVWIDGTWRRVSEVGGRAAYTLTRGEAVTLAHQIADLEGVLHEVTVGSADRTWHAGDADSTAVSHLLMAAVSTFRSATGLTEYDSDLCWDAMVLVLATMAEEETAGYPERLALFAEQQGERLRQVYREFGPGSPLAGHGRYTLVGEPVSVALFERLDAVPQLLLGTLQGELPEVWVADVASAWGAHCA